MIQPNELRIGNFLISETGEVLPVAYIMEDVIALQNTMGGVQKHQKNPMVSYDIDKLSPVKLTFEWLIKLGFKPYPSGYLCLDIGSERNYISIGLRHHTTPFLVLSEDNIVLSYNVKSIRFVHQLQNLFYCLTGYELELKPNSKTLK